MDSANKLFLDISSIARTQLKFPYEQEGMGGIFFFFFAENLRV